MATEREGWNQPCFVISVAARMVGLPAQSLRNYERTGLVEPSRSHGNIRLYSRSDIERLIRIKTLINDMGVNLAGVEVALSLLSQLHRMEELVETLRAEAASPESAKFSEFISTEQSYLSLRNSDQE